MRYGTSTRVGLPFDETVSRVRDALARQGFGVLTEIDVKATMKTKLDVDMEDYVILGACNPPLAHEALEADRSIGLLLPCNVVVRSTSSDTTLVEFLDPRIIAEHVDSRIVDTVADLATLKLAAAQQELTEYVPA